MSFSGEVKPSLQIVSAELHEMPRKLVRKHPAMVNRHGVLILHDNARPHVAERKLQALHELQYETLPYPPCCPDLSPSDYHLFQHLDHFLRGKTLPDDRAVPQTAQMSKGRPKPPNRIPGYSGDP